MIRETARQVDESAADWAVRLEEHGSEPDVAGALERWLAEDPRRQGALLRAQAALSYLDRGRALGAGLVHPMLMRRMPINRRWLVTGAAATGAIAAGVGGMFLLRPQNQSFNTRLGEVRRTPLSDGTVVAINTESAVDVSLKPKVRQVVLAKGEAWFKVAHDPSRPFIVEAGRVRVRAVGTAFSVRVRDGGAEVLVTEGIVETWVVGQENERTRLTAGSKAFVADDEPIQVVATAGDEIEHKLAWRDGQIALYGETLADAAEEFNRYNTRKIVVTDPKLAGEKVVGEFQADDPDAFVRAAASTLGATFADTGGELQLRRVVSR